MRNSWVAPATNLTGIGEWVAARVPHIDQGPFGIGWWRWRIYGLKPLHRCCLFDLTRYEGRSVVRVFGIRLATLTCHQAGESEP